MHSFHFHVLLSSILMFSGLTRAYQSNRTIHKRLILFFIYRLRSHVKSHTTFLNNIIILIFGINAILTNHISPWMNDLPAWGPTHCLEDPFITFGNHMQSLRSAQRLKEQHSTSRYNRSPEERHADLRHHILSRGTIPNPDELWTYRRSWRSCGLPLLRVSSDVEDSRRGYHRWVQWSSSRGVVTRTAYRSASPKSALNYSLSGGGFPWGGRLEGAANFDSLNTYDGELNSCDKVSFVY